MAPGSGNVGGVKTGSPPGFFRTWLVFYHPNSIFEILHFGDG
jgi:hypothetical protein